MAKDEDRNKNNKSLHEKIQLELKEQILKDLNLEKNICFKEKEEIGKKIRISKSKLKVSTVIEVKEICNISEILDRYKEDIEISISLEEAIIEFK